MRGLEFIKYSKINKFFGLRSDSIRKERISDKRGGAIKELNDLIEGWMERNKSCGSSKEPSLKCEHSGKINHGHHIDQPSWCDECGEDL